MSQLKNAEKLTQKLSRAEKAQRSSRHLPRPGRLERLVRRKRRAILSLVRRRGAANVRLFGSVARGESGPDSDIDLLVDMEPGRGLLDLGGLLMDLQELLGCRVDVATEDMLHWYIRDRVLAEAVAL